MHQSLQISKSTPRIRLESPVRRHPHPHPHPSPSPCYPRDQALNPSFSVGRLF